MSVTLGIDLGTQHVKVLVYDAVARRTLALESAPLTVQRAGHGVAEQNACDWLTALEQALQQVPGPVRERVEAVAVSGQQHGFVALGRNGQVLCPVKLWCDTSTTHECEIITDALGGAGAAVEHAGNPILPGYTASKIRWFRDTQPALYAHMQSILLPHDYMNFVLTGEVCMEPGDASGTGLLDVRTRTWSEPVLRAVDPVRDLRVCLPRLHSGHGAIGTLRPASAARFGLPPGIPVAPGGGDNMMAAIGTANVAEGRLTLSLGTSGTVYGYAARPIVDPEGSVAAFCSSTGGWLPLLCTMNCTLATELVRGLFGLDLSAFEAQLSGATRGAAGVTLVPFFTGERVPDLPRAKAAMLGLTPDNMQPQNMVRASVEGVTYGLRFGVQRLAELGVRAEDLVVTGGGSNSAAWRQIVADVCGVPVRVAAHSEGAALGAALQALTVLAPDVSIAQVAEQHVAFDDALAAHPEPASVAFYEEGYEAYRQAMDAVGSLYRETREFTS